MVNASTLIVTVAALGAASSLAALTSETQQYPRDLNVPTNNIKMVKKLGKNPAHYELTTDLDPRDIQELEDRGIFGLLKIGTKVGKIVYDKVRNRNHRREELDERSIEDIIANLDARDLQELEDRGIFGLLKVGTKVGKIIYDKVHNRHHRRREELDERGMDRLPINALHNGGHLADTYSRGLEVEARDFDEEEVWARELEEVYARSADEYDLD